MAVVPQRLCEALGLVIPRAPTQALIARERALLPWWPLHPLKRVSRMSLAEIELDVPDIVLRDSDMSKFTVGWTDVTGVS